MYESKRRHIGFRCFQGDIVYYICSYGRLRTRDQEIQCRHQMRHHHTGREACRRSVSFNIYSQIFKLL